MNKLTMNKTDLLTYIFFFLLTFCKGMGLSNGSYVYLFAYIFGILLVVVKFLNSKIYKNEIFGLISIFIIGVLDYFFGAATTILFSAVCIACMKDVQFKKIIKVMLIARIITLAIMIVCTCFGFFESPYIMHYRENIGLLKRYTFGFPHPNFAHSSYAIIVFLLGYLYGSKMGIIKLSILGIINYILYCFTYSRAGFALILLYLILLYIHHRLPLIKNIEKKILKHSLVFFIIISIILSISYTYNNFVRTSLDSVLTGRLRYMNILINTYPIPIIGSDFYNSIVLFDNGFFSLLYEGGILATLWFIYYSIKSNKIIIRDNNYDEMLLILIFMIYCMAESYYPNALMNPSLLLLSQGIFKGETKNERIKQISE